MAVMMAITAMNDGSGSPLEAAKEVAVVSAAFSGVSARVFSPAHLSMGARAQTMGRVARGGWDIHRLTLSYPRYAAAVAHRRLSGPVGLASGGSGGPQGGDDPLDHVFNVQVS